MSEYTKSALQQRDRDREEAYDDYTRSRDGRVPIAPPPTIALKRRQAMKAIHDAGTMGGDCGGCGMESVLLYPNDLCFDCTEAALEKALANTSPIALAKFYDRLRGSE